MTFALLLFFSAFKSISQPTHITTFWGLRLGLSFDQVTTILYGSQIHGKLPEDEIDVRVASCNNKDTVITVSYTQVEFAALKADVVKLFFHNDTLYAGAAVFAAMGTITNDMIYQHLLSDLTSKYGKPTLENNAASWLFDIGVISLWTASNKIILLYDDEAICQDIRHKMNAGKTDY